MKTIIVIPTYNERDNIENMIKKILSMPNYISALFVDDNSPDKTYDIIEEYTSKSDKINILKRDKKEGLGPAYIAGFKKALEFNPKYIVEMDCDFSHDPNCVLDFIKIMEEDNTIDLLIGSRYSNGISIVNWPLKRLLLSYYANIYASTILSSKIKDITGGFKCFKASEIKKMNMQNIVSTGYSFQIEINNAFEKNGKVVKETPIIFYERTQGASKMSGSIINEALFSVIKFRFRDVKKYFT